jgi:hypothetical protein
VTIKWEAWVTGRWTNRGGEVADFVRDVRVVSKGWVCWGIDGEGWTAVAQVVNGVGYVDGGSPVLSGLVLGPHMRRE